MFEITLPGIDFNDVLISPQKYEPEILAVVYDALDGVSKQIYEKKIVLSENIIEKMNNDNATKLQFKTSSGETKTATIKTGSWKCKYKSDEILHIFESAEIDPLQFGKNEYKLASWKELKEKRKFGGQIMELIDKLFEQEKNKLEIK